MFNITPRYFDGLLYCSNRHWLSPEELYTILLLLKLAIPSFFLLYCHPFQQVTVNNFYTHKILPKSGFEPRPSGVRNNRFVNCGTTNSPIFGMSVNRFELWNKNSIRDTKSDKSPFDKIRSKWMKRENLIGINSDPLSLSLSLSKSISEPIISAAELHFCNWM